MTGLHNIYSKIVPRRTKCPLGAFLEIDCGDHSRLEPLPVGGSYGHQVSRTTPVPQWLYAMEAVPNGAVKVGSTHRPRARYLTLSHHRWSRKRQAHMGLACRALWSLGVMTRGKAMGHEHAVHIALRRQFGRPRGSRQPEWYDAPLADVIATVQSYIDHWFDESHLLGLA